MIITGITITYDFGKIGGNQTYFSTKSYSSRYVDSEGYRLRYVQFPSGMRIKIFQNMLWWIFGHYLSVPWFNYGGSKIRYGIVCSFWKKH